MSWQATKAVIDRSRSRGTARLVLSVIAYHADPAGRGARLSIPTIMREANAKERAVQYALTELEESGELIITHKGSGRGYASEYDISGLVSKGAENAPIKQETGAQNSSLKGADFAPLADPERVQNSTIKGADFAEKGAKNDVKGAENAPQPIEPEEEPNGEERARAPDLHPAVAIFQEIYGDLPAPYNQDLIEQGVTNLEVWRETLTTRRGNGTPITKVGTMLKCYNADLQEAQNNGSGQRQSGGNRSGNQKQAAAGGDGQATRPTYDAFKHTKRV
jgi:predicted transcriptional regulator